jgi:hypothetical protein
VPRGVPAESRPQGMGVHMSRIKRPSPALVVAILALVAAIAVPAYALTRSEKRVVRKISKAQANKQITKRAPGLAVASARSASDTGEVHSPARLVLNDPSPGDPAVSADLVTAGPFTIRATCMENFGGGVQEDARLILFSSNTGTSATGSHTDGDDFNSESGAADVLIASVGSAGNLIRGGNTTVVAPSGEVLSARGSAEVNDPAGECVFGVTAIGP